MPPGLSEYTVGNKRRGEECSWNSLDRDAVVCQAIIAPIQRGGRTRRFSSWLAEAIGYGRCRAPMRREIENALLTRPQIVVSLVCSSSRKLACLLSLHATRPPPPRTPRMGRCCVSTFQENSSRRPLRFRLVVEIECLLYDDTRVRIP